MGIRSGLIMSAEHPSTDAGIVEVAVGGRLDREASNFAKLVGRPWAVRP